MTQTRGQSSIAFLDWLHARVVCVGRGDDVDVLQQEPRGLFWLGRLACEDSVLSNQLGTRGERLDPCAIDIRLRPEDRDGPWQVRVIVTLRTWTRHSDKVWRKDAPVNVGLDVTVQNAPSTQEFGVDELARAIASSGGAPRTAAVRVDVENWHTRPEIVVSLINTSPESDRSNPDTHLYEVTLEVSGIPTVDFELESLPDSFRYDRRIPALGRNCGVEPVSECGFRTTDYIVADKYRPRYWEPSLPVPDLTFRNLSLDPIPALNEMVRRVSQWGDAHWSAARLDERQAVENWTPEMRSQAREAAEAWTAEVERLHAGLQLLSDNSTLLRAFKLANEAIAHSAGAKYDRWRPFQIGFLLTALNSLVDPEDAGIVDVVWFATGGGKTETYLGLLCTAVLYDRLTGKRHGITAWSRFPLRMLSLQQTQRFADALAGAEIVRERERIEGDPIALGFFVGQGGTPNAIPLDEQEAQPKASDPSMPNRYQVLLHCPFCRSTDLRMTFDRRTWTLQHQCTNDACPWGQPGLPFYVVDQEIYRFLPSVVVGTLDKAALLGMQAAMRGFVGAPMGVCSKEGHGFTYATRSKTPNGCLVPGCRGARNQLDQKRELWAPRIRLQDELHLLRDSLGAVDAHYEALLDHLQTRLGGPSAKVVASSATLSGYERQIDVLYQRASRVFPEPGPAEGISFWSNDTETLARRYVAISPRGVTNDFVSDRTLTIMQQCVRRLVDEPDVVCAEAGIERQHVPHLILNYGVDVVYGNTVRDVDAARRSVETQLGFPVNAEMLTGGTPLAEVRKILQRLDVPEADFNDRIHVIAASSMMSHGVDIDRLNLMVMLGVPLTTAEFIQTTARVGRTHPGLVYVLHRVAREREAATFAHFEKFVKQGDRFVEPIPITRRSRRVLRITTPGLVEARRLAIHEPMSGGALTTVKRLKDYATTAGLTDISELAELVDALGLEGSASELARADLMSWLRTYFTVLHDPATTVQWPNELSPSGGVMRSLRDVEEAAPITEAI